MLDSPFLEDIYPQNLLYAITVRSPVSKGFLKHIQYPKLPDNYLIITARNIPGKNTLEDTTMPILADGNLSYIGEPVAILLGPDKTKLEELAANCTVIADEEEPVFTCKQAQERSDKPAVEREFVIGNPDEAFEKNGRIVTSTYSTGIQDHWYAEPVGAVTMFKSLQEKKTKKANRTSDKKYKILVVKTATQWPYHVKRCVSNVLNIDSTLVSVEPTPLSLHMDGKLWYPSLISCHAALATYITNKPVRLILNREEDFLYSPKRFSSGIDISSLIDDNGNITASKIDISVNLGAHGVNSEEILDQVCLGSIGLYKIDNLKINAKANITNIPPQGPFSGFGLSQGAFALERHVSQIADMENNDPAQWRKNHANINFILPAGAPKSNITGSELIAAAAKLSDYHRKWASYEMLRQNRKGKILEKRESPRGIGIAVGYQGNGLLYNGEDKGAYNVEVTLTKESTLEIKLSITSPEDYGKIWEKIAMETLSIEPDMLRLVTSDSPDCGPSCASRNITAITKLVEKCCMAIRKQRFHNPLPITVRRSVKPQNGTLYGNRFASAHGKPLDVSGFLKPAMACAVVDLSIDPVECIPKIRGVWLQAACGKIISVNRAKRSITRSAVQALGWAFTECIEYKDGVLPKKQFDNFAILSPVDIPPIHIDFISDDSKEARGIGELPFTCIPAAFIQAVSQAMDNCFKSIPLKRKEIWEMLPEASLSGRQKNAEPQGQGAK